MNNLFGLKLHSLLLALPLKGMLWSILLFAVCFIGVHVAKLARLGVEYTKTPKKTESEKKESPTQKEQEKTSEKKAPTQPSEPIYYIVERKQRRSKPKYGEPKEIRFQ